MDFLVTDSKDANYRSLKSNIIQISKSSLLMPLCLYNNYSGSEISTLKTILIAEKFPKRFEPSSSIFGSSSSYVPISSERKGDLQSGQAFWP